MANIIRVGAGAGDVEITKELLESLDADFTAENIKKNVDLFGLVGTYEGLSYATGEYTPADNASNATVTHNLGHIPTYIIFYVEASTLPTNSLISCIASSTLQLSFFNNNSGTITAKNTTTDGYPQTMATTTNGPFISNVTTTSFTIGISSSVTRPLRGSRTYRWIAL